MKKKLMLLTIPVIVLIICGLGALFIIDSTSSEELYLTQIELAEKCLSENDLDNAIIYFEKAIDADKTQESPYMSLAEIYLEKNDLAKIIDILQKGVDNTKSEKLKKALAYYIDLQDINTQADDGLTNNSSKTEKCNLQLLNIFNTYSYEKYSQNYAIESEKYDNDKYVVRYQGLAASFFYFDTDSVKCMDSSTKKPNKGCSPNEIVLDDLSDFIPEENAPDYDYVKALGAYNLNKVFDKSINTYVLTFVINNCSITVACDENGVIDYSNGYNLIAPPALMTGSGEVKVSGAILDKSSKAVINNAEITIRSGVENKNGSILKQIIAKNGKYEVDLSPGDYTFEVSAATYTTQFTDITVKGNEALEQNFELQKSEAAVVITVTPTESNTTGKYAELHCVIVSNSGAMGYVGHSEVYDNRELLSSDGQIVADYEEKGNSQIIRVYDVESYVDFHLHGSYVGNDYNINVKISGKGEKDFIAPTTVLRNPSPYHYETAFVINDGEVKDISDKVKVK